MDENLHNIDDLFKKTINEHEEMPSDNVWEQIDKNLDKKKVVFISKKYYKLKWVAAALLMFSAGMAMYTWHTSIKNKELVKENTVDYDKQIEKHGRKKNILINKGINKTPIVEVEKEVLTKDTSTVIKQDNKIALRKENNTTDGQKINGNNKKSGGTEKSNAEIFKKQLAAGSFEKPDKTQRNTEKYKPRIKEKSVRNQLNDSENDYSKELTFKETFLPLSTKERDSLNSALKLSIENERKEVVAQIEPRKHNLKILPANSPLQYLLEKHSLNNNKITIEKLSTYKAVKNNSRTLKKSLFSATVFYSPDFVSSKVDNDHHRFREEDRNEIKNKEEIKSSYTTGLLIEYYTGKKFSVQSGLTYSSMTTAIAPKMIYARPDREGNLNYRFNCSSGYSTVFLPSGIRPFAAGDSISALSSKNILNYITVPLAIKYKAGKGKFSLNPGLGIAVHFLKKGTIETVVGNEKASINHIEGLSSIYLNGSISAGINYDINKNIAISLTPAARFALTSINKDAPVKTYLNSYGLAAGLTLKL